MDAHTTLSLYMKKPVTPAAAPSNLIRTVGCTGRFHHFIAKSGPTQLTEKQQQAIVHYCVRHTRLACQHRSHGVLHGQVPHSRHLYAGRRSASDYRLSGDEQSPPVARTQERRVNVRTIHARAWVWVLLTSAKRAGAVSKGPSRLVGLASVGAIESTCVWETGRLGPFTLYRRVLHPQEAA